MAAFRNFSPYEEPTMDGYVDEGKSLIFSRVNALFRVKEGEVVTPFQTLVCRYYDSLKPYITTKTFTEEEYMKYRYNPRFLSYDLYGTPELWDGLLYINNMVSMSSFNKGTVKVFTEDIIDAIIEIKKIVENDLNKNKSEVEN